MKVDDFEIPENLYYSKEHEWLRVEDGKCRVGITDYAQKSLHEVVYVDLPEVGKTVSEMQSMGTVESVKAVSDVFSPVSGEVIERNEKLVDAPELVNNDPYQSGWLVVIKPSSLESDLKLLLDARAYSDFVRELIKEKESGPRK